MATSQSDPKPIISSLSPELSTVLRSQTETILRYLINSNSATAYFREAPLLSELRTALQQPTCLTPGDLWDEGSDVAPLDVCKAFTELVPLSTYEDYQPFITRFLKSPRLLSDVSNLLAPGIPAFIVSSSGTSGAAKLFLKYNRPLPASYTKPLDVNMLPNCEEGTYCAIFNLRYSEVLDVVKNRDGGESETVNQIPICFVSTAMIRLSRGWNIDQDPALQQTKIPNCTSPLAVYFIHSHQSSLLMHALFALTDNSLEKFSTIFSTTFVDLMRVVEKNWDMLIHVIATGEVPRSEGIESMYYDCIQRHFTPNHHRAEQLRAIGNDATSSPGWAKKLWPNLKVVVANSSGRLSAVVPQVRHYIGDTVILQSSRLASSEAWFGTPYDPTRDLNLYNMTTREYFEYLDVSAPESTVNLKQPWEVEIGKYYELVMTTRDGLWRYRLGDILLIVGFSPTDGQPIVRYSSRRNVSMRAAGESVAEKELSDAVHSIRDILGDVAEYTIVVDYRQTPRAYGFLVELRGEPGVNSRSAMSRLDDFLHSINTSYAHYRSSGHIGVPTIRLLSPGTFGSYREWKAQGNVLGSGPIKVPSVTSDEHAICWLMERVIQEILL